MAAREPWKWSQADWQGRVNRVTAGRSLRPDWPNGAQVAVALSFDSDHECSVLRTGVTPPGLLSMGAYGPRAAMPRILALLAEFSAPATFFVPAVSGLLHPDEIRACVDAGHEIALHGWIHERNTDIGEMWERDLTLQASDTLEKLSGRRPVGIRTPSWDFSDATLGIIRSLGLLYDSSLMADDDCYEIVADGHPTGIVEVPVDWIRDDWMYQGINFTNRTLPRVTPEASFGIYRDEFDLAYAEGGLFQLTMHPHVCGHRSRIVWLRRLLEHIAGHERVWFATHEQVARAASSMLD